MTPAVTLAIFLFPLIAVALDGTAAVDHHIGVFFLGHADETGSGEGAGFTANFPLPVGVANEDWFAALDAALARLTAYRPELLIVSLGVDTYGGDPISHFKLDEPEFRRMGRRIARFGAPTLFLQEGGYATEAIGRNVVAVLQGFERA